MQTVKNVFSLLAMTMVTLFVQAQDDTVKSGFSDTMRSNGRIYVVIAVILTILIGLILYLVRLDKKISKFEKEP